MKTRIVNTLFAVCCLAVIPTSVLAYEFTKLDVPGALCTYPAKINDSGVVVGLYKDASGTFPFIYQNGSYSKYPQISLASVGGINNSGLVIGHGGPTGRFTIQAGKVSYVSPVNNAAWAGGINSASHAVGALVLSGSNEVAYIEKGIGGSVTTLDSGYPPTMATDINDSELVVGIAGSGSFLHDGKAFTFFSYGKGASANGLANSGHVVGEFVQVSGGMSHGFVRTPAGAFSLVDFPLTLAAGSIVRQGAADINNAGWIVGYYYLPGAAGTTCGHGYLAKPTDVAAASRGCYVDGEARALPAQLMASGATPATCIAAAQARGYPFAGVQYGGQCFGGDKIGFAKVADSECGTPCSDGSKGCGGSWRNNVYATGLAAPVEPVPVAKGCFVDTPQRTLPLTLVPTSSATLVDCAAAARARGLAYVGLQFGGQCYAGNSLPPTSAPESECKMNCAAEPGRYCGGVWRNSVYATNVTPPPALSASAPMGCYVDTPERTLPVVLMSSGATPESCVAAAKARGFAYVGVQAGGQCFAGDGLPPAAAKQNDCAMPCTVNTLKNCGGSWFNAVYKVQ